MPPIILSFYRQLFATPILVGVTAVVDRQVPETMDHGWFMVVGLMGVFLNQTLYTFAVYYAGAALASILQLMNTPLTSALAIAVHLERFTVLKAIGILGAVGGAVIMVAFGKPSTAAADRLTGILISLIQAVFIAIWIVTAKKYLYIKYSPTLVAGGMHVTGLPWMVMTAFAVYGYGDWSAFHLGPSDAWPIVYAFMFHSVVAYLCTNFANANLDASICATFGTLNPLFGALMGVIILNESVSITDALGGILIFFGLTCVVYQKYKDSKEVPKEEIVLPASETEMESVASTTTEAPNNS